MRRSSAIDEAEVQVKCCCFGDVGAVHNRTLIISCPVRYHLAVSAYGAVKPAYGAVKPCPELEVLLFTIYWLFGRIIDHRFNKRSLINQCSLTSLVKR